MVQDHQAGETAQGAAAGARQRHEVVALAGGVGPAPAGPPPARDDGAADDGVGDAGVVRAGSPESQTPARCLVLGNPRGREEQRAYQVASLSMCP